MVCSSVEVKTSYKVRIDYVWFKLSSSISVPMCFSSLWKVTHQGEWTKNSSFTCTIYLSLISILKMKWLASMFRCLSDDLNLSSYIFRNAFAAFDKNKDGTIDFKEFITTMAFLKPNTVEAHVDEFFAWLVRLSTLV